MANIQIIDDDEELAENIALVLKNEGHSVDILTDTENAVEKLIQNTPDLLILDVMFPENPAGGFDLARNLREIQEITDLPVIMLTAVNQEFPMGFSSKDIDKDWMPVQDFIEKPVDIPKLITKISNLLQSRKN